MNDIDNRGDYVPARVLSKQGVTAITGIAGGIALFIMGALPFVAGLVAGGVVTVVGVSALLSKDPEDKKPGLIITIAGALVIFSKVGVIRPIAATLLGIGALGLLVMGIWNGIKFLKGLKSRG